MKQKIVTNPYQRLMQLDVRESVDMMRMEQLTDSDPHDERSRMLDHGYFPKRLNGLM